MACEKEKKIVWNSASARTSMKKACGIRKTSELAATSYSRVSIIKTALPFVQKKRAPPSRRAGLFKKSRMSVILTKKGSFNGNFCPIGFIMTSSNIQK